VKVCIIQKEQKKNTVNNIKEAISLLPVSMEKTDVDLICFQEWFLGTNPPDKIPNKFTNMLSDFAKKNNVFIATGNMRIQIDNVGKKFIQKSCLIDRNGEIIIQQQKNHLYKGEIPWYESGKGVEFATLDNYKVAITSGFDSVEEDIYKVIKENNPDIWIAQSNEFIFDAKISMYDKLVNLMKERSQELNCPIIVPMILGKFYGANYTGKSFVVKDGEIIAQIGNSPAQLYCEV
jgi:predicted amidohydrolase